MKFLGHLEPPGWNYTRTATWTISFIDIPNRRAYAGNGYSQWVAEYDLAVEGVPRLVRWNDIGDTGTGAGQTNRVGLDARSKRAYLLSTPNLGGAYRIQVLDLDPNKPLKLIPGLVWDISRIIPGFEAFGMTYSPEDTMLYFVGHMNPPVSGLDELTADLARRPVSSVAVAAIDPTVDPRVSDASTSLRWFKPIPQCQNLMNNWINKSFIAASGRGALYVPCIKKHGQPGQSGLARIWHNPQDAPPEYRANQMDAVKFKIDFFPVSGRYNEPGVGTDLTTGMAVFDKQSERFFLQSQSPSTPGVWVFDGLASAWMGFIAADDHQNKGLGVDPSSGHVFMRSGSSGALRVADGRATPIAQGKAFDLKSASLQPYLVDSSTHKVFVVEGPDKVQVFQDMTASQDPFIPPDYDSQTNNVDENARTRTFFGASTNGFGSRILQVGGYAGAFTQSIVTEGRTLSGLSSGDRGLIAGRVSGIDVRPGQAIAKAQALEADTNTKAEAEARSGQQWPLHMAACQDFHANSESLNDEKLMPAAEARAACSASETNPQAQGFASFGRFGMDGISVGLSRIESIIWRDPVKGIVTETIAESEGIEVSVPGTGKLSIAKVLESVSTRAGGRPGTAEVEFRRRLEGLVVTDALENQVSLSACHDTDCEMFLDTVNEIFGSRLHVRMPHAHIQSTDGGAFAAVQQSQGTYLEGLTVNNQGASFSEEVGQRPVPALEIVIYADSTEKSRMILQLSGIQASSLYQIACPSPNRVVGKQCVPSSGSLEIRLRDGSNPPRLLPGAIFEVYADKNSDGLLDELNEEIAKLSSGEPAVCSTGTDGIGNCRFLLDPGDYVVHQISAPPGYVLAPDYPPEKDRPFTIEPEFAYVVDFVNLKAVGLIYITLADSFTGKPISGGVFELFDDNGDEEIGEGDLLVATCTTDEAGECSILPALNEVSAVATNSNEVPLGNYVVRQKSAPDGYLPVPTVVPVQLALPGQVATLSFRNILGLSGIAITLSDTSLPPNPISGGSFGIYRREMAETLKLATCTTNGSGACLFNSLEATAVNFLGTVEGCALAQIEECLPTDLGSIVASGGPLLVVPSGDYVIQQSVTPPGHKPADDVAISLDPGQVANVVFQSNFEGSEGSVTSRVATATESGITIDNGSALPDPSLEAERVYKSDGTVVERIIQVPVDLVKFAIRRPKEASLMGGIWLLILATASMLWRRSLITRLITHPQEKL